MTARCPRCDANLLRECDRPLCLSCGELYPTLDPATERALRDEAAATRRNWGRVQRRSRLREDVASVVR